VENEDLPPAFIADIRRLAHTYLETSDPRRQSGFGGGPARWRAEREPILDAVTSHGSLLDLGCANGFLLESLRAWGAERSLILIPFGLDFNPELVALAQQRLPEFRSNFLVGNAWSWSPPQRFTYVYTLADVVPLSHFSAYLRRLQREFVEPGGRLIVGSYGSHSRRVPPLDLERLLDSYGMSVVGAATAGPGGTVRFAWAESVSNREHPQHPRPGTSVTLFPIVDRRSAFSPGRRLRGDAERDGIGAPRARRRPAARISCQA